MNKYLIPTDFSQNANDALRYAIDLTAETGGELHVLYVLTMPPSNSGTTGSLAIRMEEKAEKEMEDLIAWVSEMGREVKPYIREGSTVSTILQVAEELETECILMGTKGSTGLESIFIGSVASNVIEDSNVPVMMIPEGVSFQGLGKVVYATGLQKSCLPISAKVLKFTKPFNSRVDILHVYTSGREVAEDRMELLKEKLAPHIENRDVHFHLHEHDSIKDGILNFLDASETNLLSMVTQKRKLMQKLFDRSLTKRIAMTAHAPLLAFHKLE